ncbi:MAG: CoA transferase [Bacteroidota bacterium]
MELKELKVVELASVLAGPSVGMFFAELGAEVIKVENKTTGGDVTRRWKLPSEAADAPTSAYYHSVNYGKRVLLKDLRDPKEREEVLALIDQADVLVSNFKTASAHKLELAYEQICQRNPRLIYAQLHAFGEGIDRPAFDIVLQAETGFMYMCGEPGRDPVRMPVALIDLLAAHQLKEGILLALWQRERSGKGAYVSSSLLEAAIASLANQATNWLMAGYLPQRMGSQHPNIAPYGDVFYTSDRLPVVLAAGTDRQFDALCQCLQMEALVQDPRFATNAQRVIHRQQLRESLRPAFEQCTREELMEAFGKAGVPAGSIRNMKEVFEQEQARQMILEEDLPDGSKSRSVKTVAFQIKY